MIPEVPPGGGEDTARTLDAAWSSMRWRAEDGRFALLGFPEPPLAADLAGLSGAGPWQAIREGGETSLLVPLAALTELLERHPGAQRHAPLVWVRFELAMAWDLVGFLARVSSALAAVGVSIGAVCGFSRDHLFVAESDWPRAEAALRALFGPPAASAH